MPSGITNTVSMIGMVNEPDYKRDSRFTLQTPLVMLDCPQTVKQNKKEKSMKTIAEYKDLQVPTYALSYLVNGDASGIDDEDKRNIDEWFAQFEEEAKKAGGHVIFDCGDEEGSFTHSPEFGLACDCVSATVLIVK